MKTGGTAPCFLGLSVAVLFSAAEKAAELAAQATFESAARVMFPLLSVGPGWLA